MGWFKKKRYEGYTVDLGRFKKPEKTLTANTATDSISTASTETAPTPSFLGDLAGIGASNESSASSSYAESMSTISSSNFSGSSLGIHDKIDILTNRLHKLIERLELLELKMSRIERKDSLY